MSDTNKTHPYLVKWDISMLPDAKTLGQLYTQLTEAFERAGIPPGSAELRQESNEFIDIHFKTEQQKERFLETTSGKPKAAPIVTNAFKQVDFNPEDYNFVLSLEMDPSIDPRGDIQHLIEVCQKSGYKDFRVIQDDNEINVYLLKGKSTALFHDYNRWLTREKAIAGTPISILRTAEQKKPSLRLVKE